MSEETESRQEVAQVMAYLAQMEREYVAILHDVRHDADMHGGPMDEDIRAVLLELRRSALAQCEIARHLARLLLEMGRSAEAEQLTARANSFTLAINAA